MILALHQSTLILPRRHVTKPNIIRQAAEKRNPISDEHRHASNDQTLNESRAQELLNRDAAVDVEMLCAACLELRNDLGGRASHLFNNAAGGRGQINRVTTQDDNALVTVGPRVKSQNLFERLSTHHDRIDARDELIVAVRFAAPFRQKVEIVVSPRNEAIHAGSDKDRNYHCSFPTVAARRPNLARAVRNRSCWRELPSYLLGDFSMILVILPLTDWPFATSMVISFSLGTASRALMF